MKCLYGIGSKLEHIRIEVPQLYNIPFLVNIVVLYLLKYNSVSSEHINELLHTVFPGQIGCYSTLL